MMHRWHRLAVTLIVAACSAGSYGQAPQIPEEARRHFIRGQTAVKESKSEADMAVAAQEFAAAVRIAPSWADAYWNMGIAQEGAGKFAEAIAAFRKFIEIAPNHRDVQKAKDQIVVLEFKHEKAQQTRAAREAAEMQRTFAALPGSWRMSMVVEGAPGKAKSEQFERVTFERRILDGVEVMAAKTVSGGRWLLMLGGGGNWHGWYRYEYPQCNTGGWYPTQMTVSPDRRQLHYVFVRYLYGRGCTDEGSDFVEVVLFRE